MKPPSITIVTTCGRCGDPITAAEPKIYYQNQRICEACQTLAQQVKDKNYDHPQ